MRSRRNKVGMGDYCMLFLHARVAVFRELVCIYKLHAHTFGRRIACLIAAFGYALTFRKWYECYFLGGGRWSSLSLASTAAFDMVACPINNLLLVESICRGYMCRYVLRVVDCVVYASGEQR